MCQSQVLSELRLGNPFPSLSLRLRILIRRVLLTMTPTINWLNKICGFCVCTHIPIKKKGPQNQWMKIKTSVFLIKQNFLLSDCSKKKRPSGLCATWGLSLLISWLSLAKHSNFTYKFFLPWCHFLLCTTSRNRDENIVLSRKKYSSVLNGRFEREKVYLGEKDRSQVIVKVLSTHISLNINSAARELCFYLSIYRL